MGWIVDPFRDPWASFCAAVQMLWGIGIGTHAVSIFFEGTLLGTEWEECKTRELLDKSHRA